jgi:hexosaminidase
MRNFLFSLVFLCSVCYAVAQVRLPVYPDSIFSTYFHQRASLFSLLPASNQDIVFIGNSITDGSEWSELFGDSRIKNRGISGDITAGVLYRAKELAAGKPARVFMMIGVNDLARGITTDSIVKNILLAVAYLRQESPSTRIFVQSVLPVNRIYGKFGGHTSKAAEIVRVNDALKNHAAANGYRFVDLTLGFSNGKGELQAELTNDGLHLNGKAYLLWKHLIYPYIYDLNEQPSLIPTPQKLSWGQQRFPLYNCEQILYTEEALRPEAERLRQLLPAPAKVKVSLGQQGNGHIIHLRLDPAFNTPMFTDEGYELSVSQDRVLITAKTKHGIFNGIQTFRQLSRDGTFIRAVEIHDWPAFSYRAFMTDVGRNYQSMVMLKEQIDKMADYKLNVFHFHATEDIAWRIASKQFPQLTAPEHMLRNKGMYYSENQIRELIRFCEERHIQFVPEIDMPGHSEAFTRAMKTGMQTDSGLLLVKQILTEFMDTYDLPYVHIGADEVKIFNKNFVPEVTRLIESRRRKVIGWEPGGNFNESTIRQLWMDDNARFSENGKLQYIDSRHLYVNHMDPLEAVTTIFTRMIGNKQSGDSYALGGTLCVWHDRAVEKESDILNMNPVYPSMISFAERIWQGGGWEGKRTGINEPGSMLAQEFARFETKLLDHKTQYFKGIPFPYVAQRDMTWELFGPYTNKGNLAEKFPPELKGLAHLKPALKTTGGTVILRHWWAPTVTGVLPDPKENTTWYAKTSVWSEADRIIDCWIGFNNISRSPATDSPLPGTWSSHENKIWVNGKEILPPQWNRAGQRGHSEIPLSDEGYEYREPTRVKLKKGWNEVIVKAPIGSFKGRNWQNPEKWMFTFVVLD